MRSSRRFASDARYVVASVALVTSMGVFASLGAMRRHIRDEMPMMTAAPVVTAEVTSNDCSCSGSVDNNAPSAGTAPATEASSDCTCTTPAVEPPPAPPTPPTQTIQITTSDNDCTCTSSGDVVVTTSTSTTVNSDGAKSDATSAATSNTASAESVSGPRD